MRHAPGRVSQSNLRSHPTLLLQELPDTRRRTARPRGARESLQDLSGSSLLTDLRTHGFLVIDLVPPHRGVGGCLRKGLFPRVFVVLPVFLSYRRDLMAFCSRLFQEADLP